MRHPTRSVEEANKKWAFASGCSLAAEYFNFTPPAFEHVSQSRAEYGGTGVSSIGRYPLRIIHSHAFPTAVRGELHGLVELHRYNPDWPEDRTQGNARPSKPRKRGWTSPPKWRTNSRTSSGWSARFFQPSAARSWGPQISTFFYAAGRRPRTPFCPRWPEPRPAKDKLRPEAEQGRSP